MSTRTPPKPEVRETPSGNLSPHSLPEYSTEVEATNNATQKKAKIMIWTLGALVFIGVIVGFSVGFTRGKKYEDAMLTAEESMGEGSGAGPLRSVPTASPTVKLAPTAEPTSSTYVPTDEPTTGPTVEPTIVPTFDPTVEPTSAATYYPTYEPTSAGTTVEPTTTAYPTLFPTIEPTTEREAATAQNLCVDVGKKARECGAELADLDLCCLGLICDFDEKRCVPGPPGAEIETLETAEPTYEGTGGTGEPTEEGTGTYEPTAEPTYAGTGGTGEPTEEGTGTYEPTYEGTEVGGEEGTAAGPPQPICAIPGEHSLECRSLRPDAKPGCCSGLECIVRDGVEGPICVPPIANVPPEEQQQEEGTYSPTAELTYYPTAEVTYYPTEEGTYAPTTEEFANQVQGGP